MSSSTAGPDKPVAAVPEAVFQSVGFLLALLGAEARRRFGEALATHGLRLSHYGVLMTLANVGPLSQQALARAIGVDPRNVVPVIDALEERGLLERGIDRDDRRRHRILLTDDGRGALERLRRTGETLERDMLAAFNEADRVALLSLLGALYRSITTDRA